jgi:hypothetical protein
MKTIALSALAIVMTAGVFAQKSMTQNGTIRFFSKAPLEDIEAVNNQVSSVLNTENGDMAFSMLIKAFVFEKALMQEHFNEKYMESDKFPKSTFKGAVENWSSLKLSSTPTEVTVKGQLTIHGVTKDVAVKGKLTKTNDKTIAAEAVFTVNTDDYNITIPAAVKDNIAKNIEVTVKLSYEKTDK